MAMAKYSGMMMTREMIATTIVRPQLIRPPSGAGRVLRGRIRGAATTGVVLTSVAITDPLLDAG
jgi:hypothetical protein